jgi:hypothetical protein
MNYKNKSPKQYWETCRRAYAHLEFSGALTSKEKLWGGWEKTFVKDYNFTDKTVIDYGIGGGYLGELLHIKYGIKKYIGLDIADRSLNEAEQNLSKYNCDFHKIPVDFSSLGADIFVSLACIQHFPSKEFYVEFMDNLNQSGVDDIVIQYRFGEALSFNPADPIKCCRTNCEDIENRLPNYRRTMLTDVSKKSHYQYIGLQSIA